jgi:hypothetical protein
MTEFSGVPAYTPTFGLGCLSGQSLRLTHTSHLPPIKWRNRFLSVVRKILAPNVMPEFPRPGAACGSPRYGPAVGSRVGRRGPRPGGYRAPGPGCWRCIRAAQAGAPDRPGQGPGRCRQAPPRPASQRSHGPARRPRSGSARSVGALPGARPEARWPRR